MQQAPRHTGSGDRTGHLVAAAPAAYEKDHHTHIAQGCAWIRGRQDEIALITDSLELRTRTETAVRCHNDQIRTAQSFWNGVTSVKHNAMFREGLARGRG
jgi:hypothetical protein